MLHMSGNMLSFYFFLKKAVIRTTFTKRGRHLYSKVRLRGISFGTINVLLVKKAKLEERGITVGF